MTEVDPGQEKNISWADILGPVRHLEDVQRDLRVNEQDVIYLATGSGSKVVPMKQFDHSIGENGQSHYKVSPFVVLAWGISRLSG